MNLSGNPLLDYIVAFFSGILVSFTPCVYPLIPISVAFIGANAQDSKLRGFFLSLFYVLGIALTYSILGIIASLTGTIFGGISAHYITYLVVGLIIIIFGLSMLDLFVIPVLNVKKLPVFKRKTYFSAFLLGLVSGLLASPCLTPVLGAILVYLTTKTNILYGVTLLFSFAFGMGFMLIVIGSSGSIILARLPKSGKWMLYVKRFFAAALIATGVVFLYIGLRRM